MEGYLQADELAKRWDISIRQIQYLCKNGRIEGAEKFGTAWAIPENTPKPTRTGKEKPGRKPKKNGESENPNPNEQKIQDGNHKY